MMGRKIFPPSSFVSLTLNNDKDIYNGWPLLKLIPRVTPFNARELKVLEGTHGTEPMGLQGGQVG